MRVLLDENIDRLLKDLFAAEFEVMTVRERGWDGKQNGELLLSAEREFDAFVSYQDRLFHCELNRTKISYGWRGDQDEH